MKSHVRKVTGNMNRLSYLWLLLAFGLSLFAMNGSWDFPLAAWLYPLFLLRFTRTRHPFKAFLFASLVNAAAACVFAFQVGLGTMIPILAAVVALAVFMSLPYLVDRLVNPRFRGIVSTLIFPLSFVAVEYLRTLFFPFGSIGSLAYTQYGNLPLLQLVALTGISGIVFLMTWFASVANWVWEQHFAWPRVRAGVLLYAGLLALVLLGGGVRLALFPPQSQTVRVAGISASRAVYTQAMQLIHHPLTSFLSGKATQADVETIRRAATMLNSDLLAQSQQEAGAGARIIVWPECGAAVLQEDEPALLTQATSLARNAHIYLDMGLCVLTGQGTHMRDQAILIGPQGQVIWSYDKARPVPGLDPLVPGDGKVPTVTTPYGRISNVICFDGDFPYLSRQTGQARASLMLIPSNDWRQIDPWHTQDITFRAIENAFSLVRQTSNGLALAVDYEGRVLASSDYFSTGDQVMIASVPTQGTQTIYALVGDLFAQLCIAVLLILTGSALLRSRRQHTTNDPVAGDTSPTPEPSVVG
jgi:apolipoprotein N-acyltransferase